MPNSLRECGGLGIGEMLILAGKRQLPAHNIDRHTCNAVRMQYHHRLLPYFDPSAHPFRVQYKAKVKDGFMLFILLRHLYHNSGVCPLGVDHDGMSVSFASV